MLFSLIFILIADLIRCEFEVGMQYSYFYKTDSKTVTTESDDGETAEQPLLFSCIATIICTSANSNGHEFLLKMTGIHLTLKDNDGKVINDLANLQVDRNYSKPFVFTILHSGAVANVKAAIDEPEEILTIKTGIIGMFISVSENEIHSPVETIDNQGIYMSHWQNKTSEKAETVELSRHFTDEDFIHFRDESIDEHSFVLNVMEKRKIKAGIVSEVTSENTLLLSGKQFVKEKRRAAQKARNRQRMYNGFKVESNGEELGDDELEYHGTEVVHQATTTLKHLNTKPFSKRSSLGSIKKILQELRGSSSSLTGLDESNDDEPDEPGEYKLKHVAHFNRDFYSTRAEAQKHRAPTVFKVNFRRNYKVNEVNKVKKPHELPLDLNATYHRRVPVEKYDINTAPVHRHADRVRTKKEWHTRETKGKDPRKGHAHSLGAIEFNFSAGTGGDYGSIDFTTGVKIDLPCMKTGSKDLELWQGKQQVYGDCPNETNEIAKGYYYPKPDASDNEDKDKKAGHDTNYNDINLAGVGNDTDGKPKVKDDEGEYDMADDYKDEDEYDMADDGKGYETPKPPNPDDLPDFEEGTWEAVGEVKDAIIKKFCIPDDDFYADFEDKKAADKDFEKAQEKMAKQIKSVMDGPKDPTQKKPPKKESGFTQKSEKRSLFATPTKEWKKRSLLAGLPVSKRSPQSQFGLVKDEMVEDRANGGSAGPRPCFEGLEKCVHYGAKYDDENDNAGFFSDAFIYAGHGEDCKIMNCNFLVGAYANASFVVIGRQTNLIDIFAEYGFKDNAPARNALSCQVFILKPWACRFKDPTCTREEIPINIPNLPNMSAEAYFLFLVAGMVPLQFGFGVGAFFGLAFFVDMCLWNGSIGCGLQPSLTIRAFASVAIGFGFWKLRVEAGLRITAEITISFVPELGLSLGANMIYLKATIEISPLKAALQVYCKMWIFEAEYTLWEYSFGGWEITLFSIEFGFDPVAAENMKRGLEATSAALSKYTVTDGVRTGSARGASRLLQRK